MIKSMTGFGKGESRTEAKQIVVELRTVNHRYNDISVKLPRELLSLEEDIRKQVQGVISRGKADVFVSLTCTAGNGSQVSVDMELLGSYLRAMEEISSRFSLRDDISLSSLLRFPDVFGTVKQETDLEEIRTLVEQALEQALEQLAAMRTREGAAMREVLLNCLAQAEEYFTFVVERAPSVPAEYKEKLENRLKELAPADTVDPQRLAAEVAIFADRCSIDEEIARFASHITQFRAILKEENAIGRKLDFLVQEMNREVNTIGSKANDLSITNAVITLKSEIEKIREQIQNVE